MAVSIKLFRYGRRNQPFYRIVVANKKGKRGGKYLEQLGYYDPLKETYEIKINQERLNYWLSNGAILSEGVSKLLKNRLK